jgi:hypothetical protein
MAMIDIATGTKYYLAPFGGTQTLINNASAYHIDGTNTGKKGWALVSSYDPAVNLTDCSTITNDTWYTHWSDYNIIAYELSRRLGTSLPSWTSPHTHFWRVATAQICRANAFDDSFAKFNKLGTKIWFSSGWRTSTSAAVGDFQRDSYMITLPSTWSTDLLPATGVIAGDTDPPVRSSPLPATGQSCGAGGPKDITLQITTDENATCKYDTSNGITYTNMSGTFGTTGGMAHSQLVSLPCGAAYTYYVKCKDVSNNENTDQPTGSIISFSIDTPEGNTEFGYHPVTPPANNESYAEIVGNKFTAPATGTVNPGMLHAYVSNWSGTSYMVCGVYADNAGTYQGASKLSTDVVLTVATTGWVGGPITVSGGFVNGASYWLVCSIGPGTRFYYDSFGTCYWNDKTYDGTLPSTGPTVKPINNYTFGLYITYDSGAAGAIYNESVGFPVKGGYGEHLRGAGFGAKQQ